MKVQEQLREAGQRIEQLEKALQLCHDMAESIDYDDAFSKAERIMNAAKHGLGGTSDRPTWQDAVRDYFDSKGEADNQWWEDIIEHAERKMAGESE